MAFSKAIKDRVRKRAHYRCCICHAWDIEVHHIVPQQHGGPDTEDNAAPLCGTCHNQFGANPEKRRVIADTRDLWYEICEARFEFPQDRLERMEANIIGTLRQALEQSTGRAPKSERSSADSVADQPPGLQIVKSVVEALDYSDLRVVRLALEQLQDMLADYRDHELNDAPATGPPDLGGVYSGTTGLLELVQDGTEIEGRYQFFTADFIGTVKGEIQGREVLFRYRWDSGPHWGCGRFLLTRSTHELNGYYLNLVELEHIDNPPAEAIPDPWSFVLLASGAG